MTVNDLVNNKAKLQNQIIGGDFSMHKKLYKSSTDKSFDGVCGGIAEYFDIDSTIVRVSWVMFTLICGAGLIAYIACMLVIPDEPKNKESIKE